MRHDQSARHHDRGHARRVDEPAGQRGQLRGQQDRRDHADVHGQATHPRGRLDVDVALARIGHRAEPGRQHPHRTGREVGDDRGGQPDEGELTQRDTGTAIGQGEQTAGEAVSTAHHPENRTAPP